MNATFLNQIAKYDKHHTEYHRAFFDARARNDKEEMLYRMIVANDYRKRLIEMVYHLTRKQMGVVFEKTGVDVRYFRADYFLSDNSELTMECW